VITIQYGKPAFPWRSVNTFPDDERIRLGIVSYGGSNPTIAPCWHGLIDGMGQGWHGPSKILNWNVLAWHVSGEVPDIDRAWWALEWLSGHKFKPNLDGLWFDLFVETWNEQPWEKEALEPSSDDAILSSVYGTDKYGLPKHASDYVPDDMWGADPSKKPHDFLMIKKEETPGIKWPSGQTIKADVHISYDPGMEPDTFKMMANGPEFVLPNMLKVETPKAYDAKMVELFDKAFMDKSEIYAAEIGAQILKSTPNIGILRHKRREFRR
jgi:hypothetical protein